MRGLMSFSTNGHQTNTLKGLPASTPAPVYLRRYKHPYDGQELKVHGRRRHADGRHLLLQRRNPVLRLRHQVHRQEPGAKRQFRARENRARGHRDLVSTAAALVQGTALNAAVTGVRASWTNEPVRSAPTNQRLHALVLGPVLVHELRQTVAPLKLNQFPCHLRLPIFQILETIRTALAH